MATFLADDFFLTTPTSVRLYREFAESQPIFDYHNHLPVADIAGDRHFANLTQLWLAGDHYKWRAMRANGIPESHITGDADDQAKFFAFARTLPYAVRNPLYIWTHLELRRAFGITERLDASSAPRIWAAANEQLDDLGVHAMLRRFRVTALCTTDDALDDLALHARIAAGDLPTRVYPTFRPDRAFAIGKQAVFDPYVDELARITGREVGTLAGFLAALRARHEAFGAAGARLSDHSLPHAYGAACDVARADSIYRRARATGTVEPAEALAFNSFILRFLSILDADAGWTKQLHLGALRDTNRRGLAALGPDSGFDSIGDERQVEMLRAYCDELEAIDKLPKLIVYNLNPVDNYALATMLGNFAGTIPGKLQFGSAWWFLDQRRGIEAQLDTLSDVGLLARFVGMVTDSRSFLSFARHEYFRRVLCDVIGRDVERGEIPDDDALLGPLVRGVCYENALRFFGLPTGSAPAAELAAPR